MEQKSKIICIACSVFRAPLEALQKKGAIDFPIRYLNSMLHLHPQRLARSLKPFLKKELGLGHKLLLLYGDCHAHMHDMESIPGVVRVAGANCAEIVLGEDLYKSLSRKGCFFLFPEWALRWSEIFQKELGLEGKTLKSFMQEMNTKLLYLDFGLIPVPTESLQAISDYSGLPWEPLRVSPDHLLSAIRQALERIKASL